MFDGTLSILPITPHITQGSGFCISYYNFRIVSQIQFDFFVLHHKNFHNWFLQF